VESSSKEKGKWGKIKDLERRYHWLFWKLSEKEGFSFSVLCVDHP
jgi:hypothetical protein